MRKQSSSYSRLSSTRSHQKMPISFKTILKRRNQTIPAAQLYQSNPNQAQSRLLTRSNILNRPETSPQPESTAGIRQFVKQKGIQRIDLNTLAQDKVEVEVQEDAKSQKSSRSNASSYSTFQEMRPGGSKVPRTVEELEQKIESLVFQSIQVLKMQRSNRGLAKWAQIRKASCLDQDFKQIQVYYSELRQQLEENEQSQQKLTDLNKKIDLLQKMMANESTESELLKQQYYNWKNQRVNTASFLNRKELGSVSKFNRDIKAFNTRKSSDNLRTQEAVTKYDSTNKRFFKKISKEYYLRQKNKINTYSVNRQPMERSSYSAQFLNYGYVPTYCHSNDSVPQSSGASLAVKASSYQQDYKQKLGLNKTINFKELDCYQDKFKQRYTYDRNPNISFMNNSKKPSILNNYLKKPQKDEAGKQNCSFWIGKKKDPSLIACMNLTTSGDYYRSENQSEFIWHNSAYLDEVGGKDEILKSEVKDKKLMRLKDAFRALAMRR